MSKKSHLSIAETYGDEFRKIHFGLFSLTKILVFYVKKKNLLCFFMKLHFWKFIKSYFKPKIMSGDK